MRKIEKTGLDYYVPPWILSLSAVWQVRAWLAGGKLRAAAQWAAARGLTLEGEVQFPKEYEASVSGTAPDYVGRLLVVTPFPDAEHSEPAASPSASKAEFLEPLREREREVLCLNAEGFTNPKNCCQAVFDLEHDQGPYPQHLWKTWCGQPHPGGDKSTCFWDPGPDLI